MPAHLLHSIKRYKMIVKKNSKYANQLCNGSLGGQSDVLAETFDAHEDTHANQGERLRSFRGQVS